VAAEVQQPLCQPMANVADAQDPPAADQPVGAVGDLAVGQALPFGVILELPDEGGEITLSVPA